MESDSSQDFNNTINKWANEYEKNQAVIQEFNAGLYTTQYDSFSSHGTVTHSQLKIHFENSFSDYDYPYQSAGSFNSSDNNYLAQNQSTPNHLSVYSSNSSFVNSDSFYENHQNSYFNDFMGTASSLEKKLD